MNILPSVQEKWQVIGLNLGVPKERLDWISEEADREDIPLRSLDTFCCIKMLTYWFQNSDNVSANAIIEVIKAPHVGLKNKIPSIQEALTSSNVDLVKTTKKYTTSPPESHEMPYIEMKTNVCNEFESSQCSITGVLLYLQNTNIDPDILRNISSFPDLFKSFEAHDLLHAGDPAWLTTIAKYVKCPKALEVIEKYSRLLIADKTICSCDSYKPINGFVAKFLDKTLENCTVKDCSNAKTAVREILDLKDTDGILDHSEVGSLTFYWRVKENVTITIPKFTCASLIKNCKDNGITHIGTITDGNLELVNISELEIDEFTGNKLFYAVYVDTVYIHTNVNFVDDSNLGFLRFYFYGSLVIIPCASSVITTVLLNFNDLNFVDNKLPAKTAKFMPLENLYIAIRYVSTYTCTYPKSMITLCNV